MSLNDELRTLKARRFELLDSAPSAPVVPDEVAGLRVTRYVIGEAEYSPDELAAMDPERSARIAKRAERLERGPTLAELETLAPEYAAAVRDHREAHDAWTHTVAENAAEIERVTTERDNARQLEDSIRADLAQRMISSCRVKGEPCRTRFGDLTTDQLVERVAKSEGCTAAEVCAGFPSAAESIATREAVAAFEAKHHRAIWQEAAKAAGPITLREFMLRAGLVCRRRGGDAKDAAEAAAILDHSEILRAARLTGSAFKDFAVFCGVVESPENAKPCAELYTVAELEQLTAAAVGLEEEAA